MVLQVSLPQDAVDRRMDRHCAVASPSDLHGVQHAQQRAEFFSHMGDGSVRSFRTKVRSTRSSDTELILKFDAGF
jgi:hypothetical protein